VPLPPYRLNRTRAVPQAKPEVSQATDGSSVELRWAEVVTELGGRQAIGVVVNYSLEDEALVCTARIENQSELVVETVGFPCLTDLQPPALDMEFSTFTYEYAGARRRCLWPYFDATVPYYGVSHPTIVQEADAISVPASPFMLLEGAGRGLYVGVDEPRAEPLTFICELEPGFSDSMDCRVPTGTSIGGKQVRLEFTPVHIAYIMPGEQRVLPRVRLQFYSGDWHVGAAVYRERRRLWMGSAKPPSWASEPHSWQQVQFNSPEGERRFRFEDLPEIARECAERGVGAIQLVGWNDGGQDQNNPSHDPDPLLGGAEGLRSVIEQCQEMGVKIILFSKFVWSDRATERFRKDLVRLAIKDPYGDYYVHPGYRYQTATQILDVNPKRLVPMCFAADEWIDICREEFQKVLDLGPDGMLYDECFHHLPALVCFDESHGHRYGQPVYARDVEFVGELRKQSDAVRRDFLYAGEACTDWQLSEYQVSYHRSQSVSHVPLMRYLRPDALLMTAVTGFDDRNMINQCLLYRYIISYEPFNFKGRLTDIPLTVEYGQQMDAFRAELREWLWDGEFQDTIGARVTAGGEPHAPFSVFKSARDGSLAVVVVNYASEDCVVELSVDGRHENVYRFVGGEKWADASDGITLPPRSAVVVLEMPPPQGAKR